MNTIRSITLAIFLIVNLAGCIQSDRSHIDISLNSPIKGGLCLEIGQGFPINLSIVKPAEWSGADTGTLNFIIVSFDNVNNKVVMKNILATKPFPLSVNQIAAGTLPLQFLMADGSKIYATYLEFPFFKYIGREGDSFCFDLPKPGEYPTPELRETTYPIT
jgi:hypothetical protein